MWDRESYCQRYFINVIHLVIVVNNYSKAGKHVFVFFFPQGAASQEQFSTVHLV